MRNVKKGQVLADFLVEIQSFEPLEKESMILPEEKMIWVMDTNGASNKHGARIGIVLENSSGVLIEQAFRLDEKMMNNETEYEALLYCLKLALRIGVQQLKINLDSIGFGTVGRIIRSKGLSHEVLLRHYVITYDKLQACDD